MSSDVIFLGSSLVGNTPLRRDYRFVDAGGNVNLLTVERPSTAYTDVAWLRSQLVTATTLRETRQIWGLRTVGYDYPAEGTRRQFEGQVNVSAGPSGTSDIVVPLAFTATYQGNTGSALAGSFAFTDTDGSQVTVTLDGGVVRNSASYDSQIDYGFFGPNATSFGGVIYFQRGGVVRIGTIVARARPN